MFPNKDQRLYLVVRELDHIVHLLKVPGLENHSKRGIEDPQEQATDEVDPANDQSPHLHWVMVKSEDDDRCNEICYLEGAAAAEVGEDWALAHCEQSLTGRLSIQHVLLVRSLKNNWHRFARFFSALDFRTELTLGFVLVFNNICSLCSITSDVGSNIVYPNHFL